MTLPSPSEVFTPTDYPEYTYVDREALGLREKVANAINNTRSVVAVSGPSKSGKTVLVESVVGPDNLIKVSGVRINHPDDLWQQVYTWIGGPTTLDISRSEGGRFGTSGSAGVLSAQGSSTINQRVVEGYEIDIYSRVVAELASSEFVVFIDDFHYIPAEVRPAVARQIKSAREGGVRFCTASVPHRNDDAVRGNPELRGRITAVDIPFWDVSDLEKIAYKGFDVLGRDIAGDMVKRFSEEALGTPQIMQMICLQTALNTGHKQVGQKVESEDIDEPNIFEAVSTSCDFSSLVTQMHSGPKRRGQERKEFEFHDRTVGDVYRAVLLAMAVDPIRREIPYSEFSTRIAQVCHGDSPVGSSYRGAIEQMVTFANKMSPDERILEWDQEAVTETLHIVDPYFLFYLRKSPKLRNLSQGRAATVV